MPMEREWGRRRQYVQDRAEKSVSTSHQHSVPGQVWRILASHRVAAEGWYHMEKSRGGAVP